MSPDGKLVNVMVGAADMNYVCVGKDGEPPPSYIQILHHLILL